MLKNARLSIIVAIALVFAMCAGTVSVNAESLSDLRKQISEKENALSEGKKEEESLTEKLGQLEEAIDENESKLSVLEDELEEAEKKVDTQTENLNSRLRNMYKSGSVGFLDVLLDSGSFSEFLTNLDLVKMIYSSDKDVLDQLQTAHDEVEEKKEEVEDLKSELEKSYAVVEEEKQNIAASNEETEKMLDELKAEADRLTATIIQQGSSSSDSQYTGGVMAWPTPSSGTITSPYGYRDHPISGSYSFHTGVDIGASSGSSIVAANNGTVISSGWNGGYGKCVIVDHGGGIVTLYAHCSSLYVGVGESVSRGETIAAVGSTGNSTGPHLHFEVRVNGSYVNPLPYIT